MSKKQFKNLSHAFRWMRRQVTMIEALAWIGHFNSQDRGILEKVYREAV